MDYSKIGVRYAKALFELADERNLIDAVNGDMRFLFESLTQNKELHHYLTNPIIKSTDKIKLVNEAFQQNFNALSIDFLKLVIENRREEHLLAMCRRFEYLYKEKFGIKKLELLSAVELDENILKKIEHRQKYHWRIYFGNGRLALRCKR